MRTALPLILHLRTFCDGFDQFTLSANCCRKGTFLRMSAA
jgi:hypothetical protein